MEKLFEDINLKELRISPDGRNLDLFFVDMYKLEPFATIKCKSLYIFNYQTTLEEDEFPCYVGEVDHEIREGDVLSSKIDNLNFKLALANNTANRANDDFNIDVPIKKYHYFHIEGGEIYIEILCEEIEINRA